MSCPEAGTDWSMGRAREVGWMAAGLMIGAGACYCVYKLTIGREDSEKLEEEEEEWDDDQELDEEEPEFWFDFTTMARPWSEDRDWTEPGAPGGTEDRPAGGGKASRTHPVKQRPFPYEHKSMWSTQTFKNVTCILGLSKCPSIQGERPSAEPKHAGFSLSHSIDRHLSRLPIVANASPTPDPAAEEAAGPAPGNWNVSTEVQAQARIKMSIGEVCLQPLSLCRSSFPQQAGLNLLIGMTVLNNMLAKSVSDLKLPLIAEGSGCAEVRVLKPLMGLSEKAGLAGHLLGAQMLLSCVSLFVRNGNTELLPGTPVFS